MPQLVVLDILTRVPGLLLSRTVTRSIAAINTVPEMIATYQSLDAHPGKDVINCDVSCCRRTGTLKTFAD